MTMISIPRLLRGARLPKPKVGLVVDNGVHKRSVTKVYTVTMVEFTETLSNPNDDNHLALGRCQATIDEWRGGGGRSLEAGWE